jgi:hypothetical protein
MRIVNPLAFFNCYFSIFLYTDRRCGEVALSLTEQEPTPEDPMDKPAKALAAALFLAIAGVALAWQGQLVWTQGIHRSGQGQDASGAGQAAAEAENGYFRSGAVPGQALYGWSYPFAFPHDPLAAVQNPNQGRAR